MNTNENYTLDQIQCLEDIYSASEWNNPIIPKEIEEDWNEYDQWCLSEGAWFRTKQEAEDHHWEQLANESAQLGMLENVAIIQRLLQASRATYNNKVYRREVSPYLA